MSELLSRGSLPTEPKPYSTQVQTPTDQVTEATLRLDQALSRTNDLANHEVERLQEQARMLLRQAEFVEWQAEMRQKIRVAARRIRPAVHQDYFLYEQNGHPQLTLISPEEWDGSCPYGPCLARTRQLGDLTWDVYPLEQAPCKT